MTITANYRKITRLAIAESKRRGMTVKQLADKAGVSKRAIEKIKAGSLGNLSTHVALIIASGFTDDVQITITPTIESTLMDDITL